MAKTSLKGGDKPFWMVFNAYRLTPQAVVLHAGYKRNCEPHRGRYANSGRGRPRYPVRSMLLALMFMRFEFIPSVRKLCKRLETPQYARDICEFNGDRTPDHTTFSKFITRAKPKTIEGLFKELRDQAFRMGIIDPEEAVKLSVDSTFMKAYSRRGRKGGISDRGARVGKTERRS